MTAIVGSSFLPNNAHHRLGERSATQRPFATVTQNLVALGAHRLDTLFRSTSTSCKDRESRNSAYDEYDFLPIVYDSHADVVTGPAVSGAEARGYNHDNEPGPSAGGSGASADAVASSSPVDDRPVTTSLQNVAKLYQACQQAFGNTEPISFEYVGETDLDRKQCILTITRPNGVSRSYITKPEFIRKSEAKACAATIALEMGAIDFILYGSKSPGKKKILLAPVHGSAPDSELVKGKGKEVDESNEPSEHLQIMSCCEQWRAGRVVPKYTFYDGGKMNDTIGCVLTIEISPHCQKIYSVRPMYPTRAEAKRMCCQLALEQGVLDFIKYGGAQAAAPPTDILDLLPDQVVVASKTDSETCPRDKLRMTLQDFYETLPKPFPEDVGDKSATDINAPVILNGMLQSARGARLAVQFYFVPEPKTSLHSAILRIECPDSKEDKTYVVPARFNKKADAKSAVCLQALSDGVGDYIRSIASRMDNKVTNEMRKRANEQIIPILASEYTKLRQGLHPVYTYEHDQGAFGCAMVLSLSPSPAQGETKRWSVPVEYRTKNDAKIAVLCLAGREAIEFVRFRGGPVPPDYDVFEPSLRILEEGEIPEEEMEPVQSVKTKRKASPQGPFSQPKSNNKSEAGPSIRPSKKQKVSLPKIQTNIPVSGPSRRQNPARLSRNKRGLANPTDMLPTPYAITPGSIANFEGLIEPSNSAFLSFDSPLTHSSTQSASSAMSIGHANQPTTPWPLVAGFSENFPFHLNPHPISHNHNDLSSSSTQIHSSVHGDLMSFPYSDNSPTNVPSSHFNPIMPTNLPTLLRPSGYQDTVAPIVSSQDVAKEKMVVDRPLRTLQSDQQMLDMLRAKIKRRKSNGESSMNPNVKRTSSSSDGKNLKHMDKLLEYCRAKNLTPEVHQETEKKKDGSDGYKFWMCIGDKRLELPKIFSSVEEGTECLAKKVVQWIQSLQPADIPIE